MVDHFTVKAECGTLSKIFIIVMILIGASASAGAVVLMDDTDDTVTYYDGNRVVEKVSFKGSFVVRDTMGYDLIQGKGWTKDPNGTGALYLPGDVLRSGSSVKLYLKHGDGALFKVSIPESQTGYSITTDNPYVESGGRCILRYTLASGYSDGDKAITLNGIVYEPDCTGRIILTNVGSDIDIVVSGVTSATTYNISCSSGTGYQLEASKATVTRGDSYDITLKIDDLYEPTDSFRLSAGGNVFTEFRDVYTIADVVSNQTVTVEGISPKVFDIRAGHNTYVTVNGKVSDKATCLDDVCINAVQGCYIPEGYKERLDPSVKVSGDVYHITGDTTFPDVFLVFFLGFDGSVDSRECVLYNDIPKGEHIPTQEHYDFIRWDKDRVTEDTEVSGVWVRSTRMLTIGDHIVVTVDGDTVTGSVPVWTASTVSVEADDDHKMVQGYFDGLDITEVDGGFRINDDTILPGLYNISYADRQGSVVETHSVIEGRSSPTAQPLSEKYYVFKGFSTIGKVTADTVIQSQWDKELYRVQMPENIYIHIDGTRNVYDTAKYVNIWSGSVLRFEDSTYTVPLDYGDQECLIPVDGGYMLAHDNSKLSAIRKVTHYGRNSSVIDVRYVKNGTVVDHPVPPSEEYYTFSKWSFDGVVTEDVIVRSTWKEVTYNLYLGHNVRMVGDGPSLVAGEVNTVWAGSTFTIQPTSGYTFPDGYLENAPLVKNGSYYRVISDGSLHSLWKVTYLGYDGTEFATAIAVDGSSLPAVNEPTDNHHIFMGWEDPGEIIKNISVKSLWQGKMYRLTLGDNIDVRINGTLATGNVLDVSADDDIAVMAKAGYTLIDDYLELVRDHCKIRNGMVHLIGDLTLPSIYRVDYVSNGVIIKSECILEGSNIRAIGTPSEVEHYVFREWTGVNVPIAEDTIVTAVWDKATYVVKLGKNLIYDVDGTVYYGEGQLVDLWTNSNITISAMEGYEVPIDYPCGKGMKATSTGYMLTGNATFYSLFHATYLKMDGSVYETRSVAEGRPTPNIPGPEEEFYRFTKWNTVNEVEGDVSVTSVYSKVMYDVTLAPNVTYVVNGVDYEFAMSTEVRIWAGSIVTFKDSLTRKIPSDYGEQNGLVAVEGGYRIIDDMDMDRVYRVDYLDHDNEVFRSVYVRAGKTPVMMETPICQHYNFDGWERQLYNIYKDTQVQSLWSKVFYDLTTSSNVSVMIDGVECSDEVVSVWSNSIVSISGKPGYTLPEGFFDGLALDPGTEGSDYKMIGDCVLPRIFNVTFKGYGDSIHRVVTVLEGSVVPDVGDAYNNRHMFNGWDISVENILMDTEIQSLWSPYTYQLKVGTDAFVKVNGKYCIFDNTVPLSTDDSIEIYAYTQNDVPVEKPQNMAGCYQDGMDYFPETGTYKIFADTKVVGFAVIQYRLPDSTIILTEWVQKKNHHLMTYLDLKNNYMELLKEKYPEYQENPVLDCWMYNGTPIDNDCLTITEDMYVFYAKWLY